MPPSHSNLTSSSKQTSSSLGLRASKLGFSKLPIPSTPSERQPLPPPSSPPTPSPTAQTVLATLSKRKCTASPPTDPGFPFHDQAYPTDVAMPLSSRHRLSRFRRRPLSCSAASSRSPYHDDGREGRSDGECDEEVVARDREVQAEQQDGSGGAGLSRGSSKRTEATSRRTGATSRRAEATSKRTEARGNTSGAVNARVTVSVWDEPDFDEDGRRRLRSMFDTIVKRGRERDWRRSEARRMMIEGRS